MKLTYKEGYLIENDGKYWNHKKKMWCKPLKDLKNFHYQNEFEVETQLNRLKATGSQVDFANKLNELIEECDLFLSETVEALNLANSSLIDAFIEHLQGKGFTIIQPMDVVTEMEFMEVMENLNIQFA